MYIDVWESVCVLEFEWDDRKRQSNFAKHGVDFRTAEDAFGDPLRQVTRDDRSDYGEERYSLTAYSKTIGGIVVVVYTWRDRETIRIISARKANLRERRKYGQDS